MLAMPLSPLQISMEGQLIELRLNFPLDTRRHFNVYKTSLPRRRRRLDVLGAVERRCVYWFTNFCNWIKIEDI